MQKKSVQVRQMLGLCAIAFALAGCGGSGNSGLVNPTGNTIFAPAKALNGGTARGYVTLRNNQVVAVGVELTPGALASLPTPPPGQAVAVTGITLPTQASSTVYKEIAIAYFDAHSPAGVGDKPHFHPVFLLNSPQAPDPPAFAKENQAVAAGEVPADHVKLADVAPGIGAAFQDPAQPQAQPGWDSYGQNYFFYEGHMNGVALGATNAYLQRLSAGTDIARGDVIKQPTVYPKRGLYANRYTVHYDKVRRVFIFELSDLVVKG